MEPGVQGDVPGMIEAATAERDQASERSFRYVNEVEKITQKAIPPDDGEPGGPKGREIPYYVCGVKV
jgi:hypothetical protein